MPVIEIVNLKNVDIGLVDVLIDRRSFLGNPFILGKDGNRKEVILKFREYFDERMLNDAVFRRRFFSICYDYSDYSNIRLGCWCSPLHCHGEVIKEAMMEVLKEKNNE